MIDSAVDTTDIRIITLLKENARISFAALGRRVNLSPSATRERVQKMEDSGLIKGYNVALDHKLLGYDVEAFIMIKVFHGQLQRFLKSINKFPEVIEAYKITGNLNVHLKILVKDQLHLQDVIERLLVHGDTNTFLILSKIN